MRNALIYQYMNPRSALFWYLVLALLMIGCDDYKQSSDPLIDSTIDSTEAINDSEVFSEDMSFSLDMAEIAHYDSGVEQLILRPRFSLNSDDFYDTPWPSDARLTEAGTPDLSTFPTRYQPFIRILNTIEERVFGFANMPVIYVAFDDPIDELSLPSTADSLSPSSQIQLLALGDQCGHRIPIEVEINVEGDTYTPPHTLQVKNTVGTHLSSDRSYALVILRSLGSELGRETKPNQEFLNVWQNTNLEEDVEMGIERHSQAIKWSQSLNPLRTCLDQAELNADLIAMATVFTPQDPLRSLRAMRDVVMDNEQVETQPPENVQRDVAWSRRRLALTTYTGHIPFPIFQRGTPPYRIVGGGLVYDNGRPLIQRWESVPFAISMREFADEEEPTTPRPALVFIDGTGWKPWTHLYSRWLSETLDEGFIVFSFMPQFHGERAGVMGGPEVPTFNFFNPEAGRMNFQQQAAETSFFTRAIREQLSDLDGFPPIDVSQIVYGGHSQGAVAGALNAAVESTYAGYVFNGLSSYLTFTILKRKDLLDFEMLVRGLLDNGGPLNLFSSALQMMQLGSESVDPHNFAHLWRGSAHQPSGNHIFVINGYKDETTTPRGMDHLTLTAELPVIEPAGWEIDPLQITNVNTIQIPFSGNERSFSGQPLTLATYLDPNSGHGTIYGNPILRQMAIRFWKTALSGAPPLIQPERELMCSDGSDGDVDGLIDCEDPDCERRQPCIELNCEDDLDNDDDGLIDCEDPHCQAQGICQESECADGLDNDGNLLIDCSDPHCQMKEPCSERLCDDELDGDDDTLIDCEDPDCQDRPICQEVNCQDERDNNNDGLIDCADPDCLGALICPEPDCDNGLDEDGNGYADCDDPRCYNTEQCPTEVNQESLCDNTEDDDGDSLVDCDDPDCLLGCNDTLCADGDLGSRVGIAIFQGNLEGLADRYPPGDCTTLGTGKETPDIALRWTAPTDGVFFLSTLGSEADTVLTLYADDCEIQEEFGCHDNQAGVKSSAIRLRISADQAIRIVISARQLKDAGPIVLHILKENEE